MRHSAPGKLIPNNVLTCLLVLVLVSGCDLFCRTEPESLVEMLRIPGGSFRMGAPTGGNTDERPVHTVTISDFMLGTYEVTQAQYQTVMGYNPSWFTDMTHPVEGLTWYDAVEFCNRLSDREGLQRVYSITNRNPASGYPIQGAAVKIDSTKDGYRLPTEAEWEYAARGGNGSPGNHVYAGSTNLNTVGWNINNAEGTSHPVGTKAPNGFWIYDMSGNVAEWCWDWFGSYGAEEQTNPTGPSSGTYRVLRGGSWYDPASMLRVAFRGRDEPMIRISFYGFRLARREF